MALPPISSAQLTERVRFERRAPAQDGYGNTKGDWAVLIEGRFARLTPTRGGEQIIAARAQGVSAWDLWVMSDSETRQVNTDDRVVDVRNPDRTFNVKFVADMDGRREWLLIQLEQGGAD